MSNKHIYLSDYFKRSSLISREDVRILFSFLSTTSESSITLDFDKIEFASRSFFDELNSQKRKLDFLGKSIEIINLNNSLKQLYQIVQSSLIKKDNAFFSSIASAQIVTV